MTMSYSMRCVAAGAAVILKNRPDVTLEDAEAYAAWTIAGLLQTPPAPPPTIGGGNIHEQGPTALGGPVSLLREKSKAMGYSGDACTTCGNFTLTRNGTCMKCTTCGATSGCS